MRCWVCFLPSALGRYHCLLLFLFLFLMIFTPFQGEILTNEQHCLFDVCVSGCPTVARG